MSLVASLASVIKGGLVPKSARAYVIPLKETTDERDGGGAFLLQYFPETITDSKQTNWVTKEIPGLSHPLYQWTAGGPRIISFISVFSRDRAYTPDERAALAMVGASIASSNGPAAQVIAQQAGGSVFNDPRNVDIPSAIGRLRQFVYPTYVASAQNAGKAERARPPRKLILNMPNLRLNFGNASGKYSEDDVVCILLTADVTYEAFFNDGSPRLTKIALSFAETIQVGGRILPHESSNIRLAAEASYLLKPKNI